MEANSQEQARVAQAAAGDPRAMEELLSGVQDTVFSLSLRMLGSVPDAEDAAQEIMLRIIRGLPSFRGESAFSTWVFRVAVNHLKNERKSRFDAVHPLSFELYREDTLHGGLCALPDGAQSVDRALLAEELKRSCTNVLLQCLDPESRCVFILGTMFRADSAAAGDILGITAEAYRQKLSRSRKKVGDFLRAYCGACGQGACRCEARLGRAVRQGRLDPERLEYAALDEDMVETVTDAMEELDALSLRWRAPRKSRAWLSAVLRTKEFQTVMEH